MGKKLRGKALAESESKRNVGQEIIDSVQEIKAGGGKRTKVKAHADEKRGNFLGKGKKKSRNKGLVKLLLSCPVTDWFQPLDRTETTDFIKGA